MVPLQSPEKEWGTLVSTDTAKEPGPNLTNWGLVAERENEDGWGLLPVTVTAYVALIEFGLSKTTCKVPVDGDDDVVVAVEPWFAVFEPPPVLGALGGVCLKEQQSSVAKTSFPIAIEPKTTALAKIIGRIK